MIYKVENESPNPVEQTTAPAGPAHAVAGHSENSDSENSDLQMRLDLARQFGNTTIAYSTVCQPGLKYHYSHDGFQAYGTKWGYDYGLGDSVVAPSDTGKLLGAEIFAPEGEHLAHLLTWVIALNQTVDEVIALPFYHPVVEEGLRTALRKLSEQIKVSSAPMEVRVCS